MTERRPVRRYLACCRWAARYNANAQGDNRMSVCVIVQGKIENRGLLDQYVAKVMPTIESHHGRVVAFDEQPEVIEGPIEHPRTVVLEFPSMTAFHAWYDSPEYQEILPLRLKSVRGTLIVAKDFTPS